PPPPPPPPPADPLSFGPRLALLKADEQPVIGQIDAADDTLIRKSLIVKNQIVGWLVLKPLRQITNTRELDFIRQQSHTFLLIAAALLAGAALLALLLAQQLTRPLRKLTGLVKNLASGDYQTYVHINGQDEIAELGRDINTLARTLADNQQARQRWIADISHELRTPLTVVRGELEALEDGVRPFNQAGLQSLQNEIDRLSKLIEDLHELSLVDLGALSYQWRPLDLREILTQVADTFVIRAQRHGLTLALAQQTLPKLPVNGDRQRLLQLFSNLLENSVRYTDAGGRIEVTAHVADQVIRVFIDDSPPGVALEECPRLFERLYRVDASRSRTRGGSGLGLAICQSIVTAHEGAITAQPSPLGGLRISVSLPRYFMN
ncbi:MAG: HAMP domain-containing protein, partial [Candidatus Competibacteraceae bacterium]|nr:HAMP domain-containing protein [Candidatus Competibacteraceae bacterium]